MPIHVPTHTAHATRTTAHRHTQGVESLLKRVPACRRRLLGRTHCPENGTFPASCIATRAAQFSPRAAAAAGNTDPNGDTHDTRRTRRTTRHQCGTPAQRRTCPAVSLRKRRRKKRRKKRVQCERNDAMHSLHRRVVVSKRVMCASEPNLEQDGPVLHEEVLHEEVGPDGGLVVERERLVDVL